VDAGAGGFGSRAMSCARIPVCLRAGRDSAHAGAALRAVRVLWVPFTLASAALVVTDAAIRYRGVARLTLGVPGGWTPETHPMFRQGVRGLLDSAADLDVVAEAATGDAALELAASAAPDVVLMDIQIPIINGIEVTRRIVTADPDAAALVLTKFDDDSSVFAAMLLALAAMCSREPDRRSCS
jgi:CheY-like chemotaxis protein